jgi:hypothetical protein
MVYPLFQLRAASRSCGQQRLFPSRPNKLHHVTATATTMSAERKMQNECMHGVTIHIQIQEREIP